MINFFKGGNKKVQVWNPRQESDYGTGRTFLEAVYIQEEQRKMLRINIEIVRR